MQILRRNIILFTFRSFDVFLVLRFLSYICLLSAADELVLGNSPKHEWTSFDIIYTPLVCIATRDRRKRTENKIIRRTSFQFDLKCWLSEEQSPVTLRMAFDEEKLQSNSIRSVFHVNTLRFGTNRKMCDKKMRNPYTCRAQWLSRRSFECCRSILTSAMIRLTYKNALRRFRICLSTQQQFEQKLQSFNLVFCPSFQRKLHIHTHTRTTFNVLRRQWPITISCCRTKQMSS